MRDLLAEAAKEFDQVIVDAPPVSLVVDPVLLATQSDGVVVVVEAGRVNRTHVAKTIEQLERASANIFGLVLNKEDRRGKKYYAYRSYYQYARENA